MKEPIKKISIVVPVYNEKETVGKIISRVIEADIGNIEKEIIIVNDGSDDGTKEELEIIINDLKERIKVVNLSVNQGKSMALRKGFEKISGEVTVVQDADLEYDPGDFKKMLTKMRQNGVRVVYGSRQLGGRTNRSSGFSYYLGGQVLTYLANLLYGVGITDEPTCYKMFDSKLLRAIKLESVRFEFCPEITAKVAKMGVKIYEVPIGYWPRSKKQGKKIKLRDFWEAVWVLVKNKFNQ